MKHQLISRPSRGTRQLTTAIEPPSRSILTRLRREKRWGGWPHFTPIIRGYARKRCWTPKLCTLSIRRIAFRLERFNHG